MKLSLNFSSVYTKAKQNISIVLIGALAVLVVLEVLALRGSWGLLRASQNSILLVPPKLTRVNFTAYESIVKRFENVSVYVPEPFTQRIPFGPKPPETPETPVNPPL